MKFAELRAKHPRFIYQQAAWQHSGETLSIQFKFLLEPAISFSPNITIAPITPAEIKKIGQKTLQNWVFHLGLVELFSYWKAAAPAEIVIQAGYLDQAQLAWWKDLLLKSMGEFFYTNQLDFTQPDFVALINDLPIQSDRSAENKPFNPSDQAPYLVPVGGGKDSAVVIELLEENALSYDILLSHPQSPAAIKISELSRSNKLIQLHRTLDPKLIELNQLGYLNGHTPFSARLAFESSLVGLLLGHQQILVGNEYSANEGNVPFHGSTVNHQYSKTFEFEQSFRQYVQQYLSPAPEYLSLLRPIYELQIAALFAQYHRYHSLFKSCNRNQQQESWCCECAKCLFVFTVLYPFLAENQLIGQIFPRNLFENASLNQLALALLGKDAHKPFECVGTYQETLTAFYLSVQQFRRQHPGQDLPPVLKFVEEQVLTHEKELSKTAQTVLCFWNTEHNLGEKLENIVHAAEDRLCHTFQASQGERA